MLLLQRFRRVEPWSGLSDPTAGSPIWRRTRWLPVLWTAAFLLLPGGLPAQETLPCVSGDRVRVSSPLLREHVPPATLGALAHHGYLKLHADRKRGRVIATVVEVCADSLTVEPVSSVVNVGVPWESVTELELSGGHISRGEMVARTALLGGVAGVLFGAGMWLLISEKDCGGGEMFDLCFERRDWPQAAASVGGVGAASGALAGLIFSRPERWTKVSLPVRVGMRAVSGSELVVVVSHPF
jgi:hypothetical protein